ncbi:MAG: ATP-dependent helicase, partial [Nannocystaceae bacterium]
VGLKRRFLQVLVDEFQDTNPVQARLVRALSGNAEICVVGDDDQAIYGWRGADVSQILSFTDRHPGSEIIRLEQNYRSTSHILECAHEVIRRNVGRHGKKLWSDLGVGEPVRVLTVEDEREEARWIANDIVDYLEQGGDPNEVAIFYRTHAQSRAVEEALRLSGLFYNVFGGLRFFDRKEIKDLVGYLRLLVNRASDVDFLRVVNVPSRKIGKTTMTRLSDYASLREMSLWDAVPFAADAKIGAAACRRLLAFRQLVDALGESLAAHGDLGRVASDILEQTGYVSMLEGEGSEEAQTRVENLQEFVGELEAYSEEVPGASLADYLEQVSLATTLDGVEGERSVTMMTIHSAKGLEFGRVYLTGMEEGVFPHARVLEDPDQMEEERRLAYVAVTRAKRMLTISWARARRLYGVQQVRRPSRFIGDLPREHVALVGRGSYSAARPPSRVPSRGPSRGPARREHWDSDVEYDEPASRQPADEGVSIYVGMQVEHKKFGIGEVTGWDGGGASLKLVLRFPRHGTKTIMARFCQPV